MELEAKRALKEIHEGEPLERLHSITSSWPFYMWGFDILGSFPLALGNVKFLMVAVDYFTKRIEVEPAATILAEREEREMAHICECAAKAKMARRYNATVFLRSI
ncbi:hypothetical protein CR513_61114, partial [Mucuna pruriens]